MKTVRVKVENGKILLDFEGFRNNRCNAEELAIRALMAKMGVKTEVDDEKKKTEKEKDANGERQKTFA